MRIHLGFCDFRSETPASAPLHHHIFCAGDERRRLAPIPVGWAEDSDLQLAAYCEAAKRVAAAATDAGRERHGGED